MPRHQRTIERDFVSAATASGEEINPEFAALRNLTARSCSRYALYNIRCMTKEQQIARLAAVVDTVLTAENNIPDEEKQALVTARGTGESMEQRVIERYIRAVATEIVKHGGMPFVEEDESDGLIDP